MKLEKKINKQESMVEIGSFITHTNNYGSITTRVYMEAKAFDKNEIRKELYKLKTLAKFSHYVSGNIYYTVDLTVGRFQFPIPTVETTTNWRSLAGKDGIQLSEDLGTTTFESQMKGSELIRWINKAIDNDEFIEVTKGGLNLTKLDNDIDRILDSMDKDDIQDWLDKKK